MNLLFRLEESSEAYVVALTGNGGTANPLRFEL